MRVLFLIAALAATTFGVDQQAPPPADQVYAAALERARAEKKLVFFEFGASWCAPCRRLEAFLAAPENASILAKYYVLARVTVWENKQKEALNHPGGSELMYRLGGGDGVPYFGISDASGTVLENSRKAKVDYPAKRAQVETFMGLIDRTAKGMPAQERKTLADFLMRHADAEGSIGGRVLDPSGAPMPGAEVVVARPTYRNGRWVNSILKRLKTDDAGRYLVESLIPGDYVTTADHGTAFADSESLSLNPGDDLQRDIVVRRSYASMSGTVLEPSGRAASTGEVTMTNVAWPEVTATTPLKAGGRFEFAKLIAGDYVLSARLPSPAGRIGARHEITVAPGQRGTMDVVTHSGASVSGIIQLPPGVGKTPLGSLEVLAISAAPPGGSASQTSSTPATASRGFAFRGLFGNRYLRIRGLPEGWFLESVRAGEVDTTDRPLDLSSGTSLEGVEIVLSDAGGQITGHVTSADSSPTSHGAAIVFPVDARRRAHPSRFVRRAAVDDAGTFVVAGLPPGEYLVAAVQSLSSAWDAPESLEALEAGAMLVRVERRGKASLTVELK